MVADHQGVGDPGGMRKALSGYHAKSVWPARTEGRHQSSPALWVSANLSWSFRCKRDNSFSVQCSPQCSRWVRSPSPPSLRGPLGLLPA